MLNSVSDIIIWVIYLLICSIPRSSKSCSDTVIFLQATQESSAKMLFNIQNSQTTRTKPRRNNGMMGGILNPDIFVLYIAN